MKGRAMQALVNRAILVLALTEACLGSAQAQEWLLNSGASRFYMQTVKASSIFEVHQFSGLDGSISNSGDANVKIDLTSVASGIDVRARAAVFTACAARKGRNHRDRAWRLSRASRW